MKKSLDEHRYNLRLNVEAFDAIDQLRCDKGVKISRNSWLAQAVSEKIERDSVQQVDSPNVEAADGFRFFEFFAGGGMARAGLGEGWSCVFSNDFDTMKAHAYRANWGGGHELLVEDVNKLLLSNLPGEADLVWASFPCQDLSLAGNYEGIGHWGAKEKTRSGTFWPFWKLMRGMMDEGRAPRVIVLENVHGILTSNDGKDFSAIGSAFSGAGYRFGAMVIDAKHFVPQSRPRVFIVAVAPSVILPNELNGMAPVQPWHPVSLQRAHAKLTKEAQKRWIWWGLTAPKLRPKNFVDIIEEEPIGVKWHTIDETKKLISMMSSVNKNKLEAVIASGQRTVGGVYKRTRLDENGNKVQRAEVRFDDVAGCLRTPAGGSSRQTIILVEGTNIRSRLLSAREAARLMGLPDSYKLPVRYNDAYHLAGDGVVVPVVSHLANNILKPILEYGALHIERMQRAKYNY